MLLFGLIVLCAVVATPGVVILPFGDARVTGVAPERRFGVLEMVLASGEIDVNPDVNANDRKAQ